jgi:integrase
MLTVAKIRKLQPRDRRFSVTAGCGLELEVLPSGIKSWRLRYRLAGRQNRVNLGRWPGISLAAARAERDRLVGQIKAGIAPASRTGRARGKAATFEEFAKRYVREVVAKVRKDVKPVERWLKRDLYQALGKIPLRSVTATDVRELVFAKRDSGSSQAAVALRGLIKRIFDYAIVCGIVQANPAHAVPNKFIARAMARERALSEPEIGLFLRRLAAAPVDERYKIAFRLILLTLVRKSELRLARWEHINFIRGEWEIPPELSKTRKGQIVYLSRQSAECFAALRRISPGTTSVLPMAGSPRQPISPSTLNRALKTARGKMAHFTVHDLRRTAATRLSEMGYESDWIEKCLNHTIKGVRGVYNRAQYSEQRKKMLQEWADAVERLET